MERRHIFGIATVALVAVFALSAKSGFLRRPAHPGNPAISNRPVPGENNSQPASADARTSRTASPDANKPRPPAKSLSPISTSEADIMALEKKAESFLKQGHFTEAIERASACLSADPNKANCWWHLINANLAMGGIEQAMPAIEECLQVRPTEFFCIQKARDFHLARGDAAAANRLVEESFSRIDDPAARAEALSRFYAFTGEKQRQREALTRACKLGDRDACLESSKMGP